MNSYLQRRAFLGRTAVGILGSIAWNWLQAAQHEPAAAVHHLPRADRVIVLFQNGGPSQMDLFDPKPELARMNGKPFPGGVKVETLSPAGSGNLLGSPFAFRPAGESGMLLSELIPQIASIADDMTLVRSMTTESVCHETALRIAHSGHPIATDKPSFGSWLTYGLDRSTTISPHSSFCRTRPECRSMVRSTGPRAGCRHSTRARRSIRAIAQPHLSSTCARRDVCLRRPASDNSI